MGALTAATLWGQASGDISSALLTLDIAVGVASLALLPRLRAMVKEQLPGAAGTSEPSGEPGLRGTA